jgi:hypothetical protein
MEQPYCACVTIQEKESRNSLNVSRDSHISYSCETIHVDIQACSVYASLISKQVFTNKHFNNSFPGNTFIKLEYNPAQSRSYNKK